jgi:hypothetical protein
MKKLLLLVTVISTLFSCEKEYSTTVKGRVINMYSNESISNAVIYFQDGVGASTSLDFSGAGPTIRDSVFADKDGYYSFSIKSHRKGLFITAEKKGYDFYCIKGEEYLKKSGDGGNGITQDGLNENIILNMTAEAFFFPFFKKTSEIQTDSDVLNITVYYGHDYLSDSDVYSSVVGFSGKGIFNLDDPIIAIGDKYFHYKLQYTSSTGLKTKIDSVFISGPTTYTDTIFY